MAHRYHETILVRRDARPAGAPVGDDVAGLAGGSGAPTAFAWRGVWYRVDEILATWRLRDRWWAGGIGAPAADVADVADVAEVEDASASSLSGSPLGSPAGAPVADVALPTERVYFRALCRDPEGVQVFDLYYDVANGQWMLDRAHD